MNRFVKSAALAAGVALVSQAAQAQFANGDLVLGFTESGAANDYILDLGNYQSAVGVGGLTPVDLSSQFSQSTFNSDFTGGLNGVEMGVVGGSRAFASSFVFETAPRLSLGTPGVAGSSQPFTLNHSSGQNGLGAVVAMANGLSLSAGLSISTPRGGSGAANVSWFNNVPSATPPSSSYFTATGYDPDGTASGNVIYEDLWGTPATSASGSYTFSYEGYFTLDLSGASPSLTFTPSAAVVPEPTTLSLLAGSLLLVPFVRRRGSRNSS